MSYLWDVSNTISYNNRMGKYKFNFEYGFINKFLIPNSKILDVGGGSGRFAIPIHNLGYEITVLDNNKEALDILSNKNSQIQTVHCNFMEYKSDLKYDIILAIEVLIYINDWDLFFSKIDNLLNNNGRFIFSTINTHSWRFFLRKLYHRFNDHSYFKYHSLEDINSFLSKYTLKVETVEGFYWLPFKLNSNNLLIEFFIYIEKLLKLKKYISQSPWLMISIIKNT